MFKNIVAATDFSKISLEALKWAAFLSGEKHSNLHLIHVLPETNISISDTVSPEVLETLTRVNKQDATKKLDKIVKRIKSNKNVNVDAVITQGSPHHEILKFADKKKGDIIVLGTRGLSDLEAFIIGSTASRVTRGSKIPVLVIRKPKRTKAKKILVPTDLSKVSLEGLKFAVEFAQDYEVSSIDVLTCIESSESELPDNVLEKTKDKLKKEISKLIGSETNSINYNIVPAYSVPEGIIDFVQKKKIDLIIMASHGRSGVSRILLGSNAEKVVKKSSVPVIVVKKVRGKSNS